MGPVHGFAGEGPDREALERHASAAGIAGRVTFLGAQPRRRIVELFRAADASILSSSWENFPHTVVEALAAGTPVLSTATGGVAEVVRDGVNGLLVEPGNADAYAEMVRRFLGDAQLRERLRAAAAPSVEAYAPERILGRLEQVLHGAQACRAPRVRPSRPCARRPRRPLALPGRYRRPR